MRKKLKEIKQHYREAQIEGMVEKLLAECEEEEPELMLSAAYKKRIRAVPLEVVIKSVDRLHELRDAAGFDIGHDAALANGVLNLLQMALWKRLSVEKQREWLRKVE